MTKKEDSTPPSQMNIKPPTSKKTQHWCEAIPVDKRKCYDLWASYDEKISKCNGGGNIKIPGKKQLWTSTNDDDRFHFKWDIMISINEWFRIAHGNLDEETKINIWNNIHNSPMDKI